MEKKKITPVRNSDGSHKTADGGAASQDRKPMHECECGQYVVWHQSKKSGKWYLADCFQYLTNGNDDSYWYAANSPHFKTCKGTGEEK